ncbi:MAG: Ig-like domain-containing protein, partial [bacterium]
MSVTRPKRRGAALTASGAALVLASGVMIVAFASPGSHASLVSSEAPANGINGAKPLQPAVALQMVSMTPAAGAKGVNGTRPIRVRFS